ncbi:MAG: hypothetical protein AAGA10_14355 [Bacteroidota bacterium]
MNRNLRRLIHKLEGSPDGKSLPQSRLLIFRIKWDVFEVLTPKHRDTLTEGLDPQAKTLLLIHGTFSTTAPWVIERDPSMPIEAVAFPQPQNQHKGSFGELLERPQNGKDISFLKEWMQGPSKYQQVIAYDHSTVLEDVRENTQALMKLLSEIGGESFAFEQPVDLITSSRGGLLGQFLSNTHGSEENPKVPIGNAVIIASPNRGSNLLAFEHLSPKIYPDKKKTYAKALARIVEELSLHWLLKLALKMGIHFNRGFIHALLEQPGVRMQRPGSDLINEIKKGKPSNPHTRYLPVIGKYEGLAEELEYIGPELTQLVRRIGERYENFAINFFFIFRLKATWFLSRKKLEENLMRVLTLDVRHVIRELLFLGEAGDLVNSSASAYALPKRHLAEGFDPEKHLSQLSVAIHSYYLDEYFKPFQFDRPEKIKDIVKQWLEKPEIGNRLAISG